MSYGYKKLNSANPLTSIKTMRGVCEDYKIYGQSVQNGTPSPENPIPVISLSESLPQNYQEVDYIQSSGTQYIDTGITPSSTTDVIIDAKIMWVDYNSRQLMGFGNVGTQYFGIAQGSGYYELGDVNISSVSGSLTTFDKVIASRTYANNTITLNVNGNNIVSRVNTASTFSSILIFRIPGATPYWSICKIKSFKIYTNSTLVRNFIPCIRVSDSAVGLYDTVSTSFYTNAGTGVFTAGDAVGSYFTAVVSGKNLLNPAASATNFNSFQAFGSGGYTNAWVLSNLKPSTTYRLRFIAECLSVPAYASTSNPQLGFVLYSAVGGAYVYHLVHNTTYLTAGQKVTLSGSFTTPSYLLDTSYNYRLLAYTQRYLDGSGNGLLGTFRFSQIQLELGSTATSYEPYQAQTLTDIFVNEPLRKIGTVADYARKSTGKITRNIGKYIFTGTETAVTQLTDDAFLAGGFNLVYLTNSYISPPYSSSIPLCTHIIGAAYPGNFNHAFVSTVLGIKLSDTITGIVSTDIRAQRIEKWKALFAAQYAAGTPIMLYYQLATPTEEPIILPQIPVVEGTSILDVSSTEGGVTVNPSQINVELWNANY